MYRDVAGHSITKCEDGVRSGMLSDYELNVNANTEDFITEIEQWKFEKIYNKTSTNSDILECQMFTIY